MPASSLSIEVDEDNMEIGTSPYPHQEDVEIDFTDTHDPSAEDNSMLDDAGEETDLMQADSNDIHQDDIMYEEEDLIDFDDDFDMNTAEQGSHTTETQDPVDILTNQPSAHIKASRSPSTDARQSSTPKSVSEETLANFETEPELLDDENVEENTNKSQHEPLETLPRSDIDPAVAGDDAAITATDVQDFGTAADGKETAYEVEPEASAITNDQTNNEQLEVSDAQELGTDEPQAAADIDTTSLHTVMVEYDGQFFHMFPPSQGETVNPMLEDSGLAYKPIDDVLQRLHDSLGDYMGHDDEVVLDIPSLGLHICEDSKYAKELTLAQVVDTYMLLSQNQQLSEIEPLYCQLSHRVCLKTQMNYLVSSAREGKTYATIVEEHVGSPEPVTAAAVESIEAKERGSQDAIHSEVQAEATEELHEDRDEDELQFSDDDVESQTAQIDEAADSEHEAVHNTAAEAYQSNADNTVRAEEADNPDDDNNVVVSTEAADDDDVAAAETDETHRVEQPPAKQISSSPENDQDTVNEEDLFADMDEPLADLSEKPLNGDTHSAPLAMTTNGHESTSLGWANDEALPFSSTHETPTHVATTPRKSVNGKRKLVEDDEESLLDFSTPEPKRTKGTQH